MNRIFVIFALLLAFVAQVHAQKEQSFMLTGTVFDEFNEPVPGANVYVKDKPGVGITTNIDGKFRLKVNIYDIVVVSFLGYENYEQRLTNKIDNVKVTLKPATENIDEVVVVGMGTQRKVSVAGAITTMDPAQLEVPATNIVNTLAGRVAGVIGVQSSGEPGKNISEFWVRGIGTFGANSGALVLIDGLEGSLSQIDAADVESFSVLKDAAATAVYGSRGANGVVLITTKRGKAGKINIDAKVETSYNTRTITPEFVDGLSYASLMNEALVTRNLGMAYQPEELELFRTQMDPDFYPNVDWMDLILKNGAWSYRANLNMNGGGNTARYFVSASYTEDQGMYNTDQTLRDDYDTNANYKKWNYRMNVDIDITKSTLLKLGIAGSLAKRNSPGLADNEMLWGMLFGYNPIATPVYYSNGYAPISHRDNVNKLNPWVASTQTGYNED